MTNRHFVRAVVAGAVAFSPLLTATPASALPPVGTITTFAGGPGRGPATEVSQAPQGIAVGPDGSLYIADAAVQVVRRVDPSGHEDVFAGNGELGTAGDGGPALDASFITPVGLAVDAVGDVVIADSLANRIRVVAGTTCAAGSCPLGYPDAMTAGDIYPLAGTGDLGPDGDGGTASSAKLRTPTWIDIDPAGDLVILDSGSSLVRMVAAADCAAGSCPFGYPDPMTKGDIYAVAGVTGGGPKGDDLPAITADIQPIGIAVDQLGNLLINDGVDAAAGHFRLVAAAACSAGSCPFGFAGAMTKGKIYPIAPVNSFGNPQGIAVDAAGDLIVVDVSGSGSPDVVIIDRSGCTAGNCPFGYPNALGVGGVAVIAGGGSGTPGQGDGGPATDEHLVAPRAATVDGSGNLLVADTGNGRVRLVPDTSCAPGACAFGFADAMTEGDIYAVAGGPNGYSGEARAAADSTLATPGFVDVDPSGNVVFDESPTTGAFHNNRVLVVPPSSCAAGSCPFGFSGPMTAGAVYTVVGGDGATATGEGVPAATAFLVSPGALAVDPAGNLLVVDALANRVRMVAALSCSAGSCPYGFPGAMTSGDIYSIVGTGGVADFSGDGGLPTAAGVAGLSALTLDDAGNLLIANSGSVRMVAASSCASGSCPFGFSGSMTRGRIYTVAGTGTPGLGSNGGVATSTELALPTGLAVDPDGDLIVDDGLSNTARIVAASPCAVGECPFGLPTAMQTGHIYKLAGDGSAGFAGDGGPAAGAEFFVPAGLEIDPLGDLLIADGTNGAIRMIANASCSAGSCPLGYPGSMTAGDIYSVAGIGGLSNAGYAGDGGPATSAHLALANSISLDTAGNLLIADAFNNRIREVRGTVLTPPAPPSPTVTGLSPMCGPPQGGSTVTVTGRDLRSASSVAFGSNQVTTGLHVTNRGRTLTVSSPAGTGTVGLTVTTPTGTSPVTSSARFSYDDSCVSDDGSGSTGQSIKFTPPAGGVVGDTATLTATGGKSGKPVVFSVDPASGPGVCTVSGNTVTYLASGFCIIDANQAGGNGYSPAPPVSQTIEVTDSPPGVTNPTITARVSDGGHKLHHGWYRFPVTVTFHCHKGSSPLAAPCPVPVVLKHSGKSLSVTKTIKAIDGGRATVTVSKIKLDRIKPTAHVHGAEPGHTYRSKRHLTCTARDSLSGPGSCSVQQTVTKHDGLAKVRWTATATDQAGNHRKNHGSYRISSP